MKNVCKQSETCEKISARINPQLSSQNWKSQEIPIFGLIFSIFVQNITIWGDFKVLSESKIKKLNPYKISQLSSISVFSHVFWQFRIFDLKPIQNREKRPILVILGRFCATYRHILKVFTFVVYLESATRIRCYVESHVIKFSKLSESW